MRSELTPGHIEPNIGKPEKLEKLKSRVRVEGIQDGLQHVQIDD